MVEQGPSAEKLAEIKKRWANATPGEWRWKMHSNRAVLLYSPDPDGYRGKDILSIGSDSDDNYRLEVSSNDEKPLEHSSADVRWLIRRAEALEDELRTLYKAGCELPWTVDEHKKWTKDHGLTLGSALARVTRFLERD